MAAAAARTQAYIVAAKRTPFGDLKASELGGLAGKAALATLPKETKVDSVIFGSVSQTDNSGAYVARHVGHYSGLPVTVPALTVNRLCGSGFQSVVNAVQEIQLGESNIVLTGGTENMSLSPYTLHGVRFGNTRYGVDQKLVDSLAAALIDQVPGGHPGAAPTPMGVTAENLAQKYGITREQCDAYALRSQQRWAAAQEAGAFNDEISPVELKGKKGTEVFSVDEHPRPTATPEALAKLPSVFIKQTGTVSAGNASGIGDGAAANVVASEAACQQWVFAPHYYSCLDLCILGTTFPNCIMGIGPVEAIKIALSRAGLKKDDIDLWDVNEAFAAQWLAVQKELELPDEISNVFGGAIALAHPLGASGARYVLPASLACSQPCPQPSETQQEIWGWGGMHWRWPRHCIGIGEGIVVWGVYRP
ncbi:acetyl-Coenzyme A acyltransferase 2 [Rhizoctonia solani AG-1 IA]|uniref:Acetyl-Coenzyme A acyltransferase 2 n=1 Tax=Thanatephorus cucumeris (strain AG1-IA) TaxID=983506 RepID=L8X1N0_THACA|nr:acetyl-Coenzyme A acyltransferase 2 [Rhizoctonia solani AG-1 IA]